MRLRALWLTLFALLSLSAVSTSHAQLPPPTGGSPWVLVPPFFVRGALISLLGGNPNEVSDLHVRLFFPDGYRMAPHSHPRALHIQILQGSLRVGIGKRFDLKQTRLMAVGDTGTVPPNTPYYYVAKGRTILDATSIGPFELAYVNPADDPSRSTPFGH